MHVLSFAHRVIVIWRQVPAADGGTRGDYQVEQCPAAVFNWSFCAGAASASHPAEVRHIDSLPLLRPWFLATRGSMWHWYRHPAPDRLGWLRAGGVLLHRYSHQHFNAGWGITRPNVWHLYRLVSQFINFLEVISSWHLASLPLLPACRICTTALMPANQLQCNCTLALAVA